MILFFNTASTLLLFIKTFWIFLEKDFPNSSKPPPLSSSSSCVVFLTFFGLASIGLSCLVALFIYHVVFGVKYLGILNGVAAFIIIGIGECSLIDCFHCEVISEFSKLYLTLSRLFTILNKIKKSYFL